MNLLAIASSWLGALIVALFIILLLLFIALDRKPAIRRLREISAFLHLRRAVGQAVEAGTRLHVSLGRADLTGMEGAVGLAGLTALERAARAASISDRPPIATSGEGTLGALSQETLKSMLRSVSVDREYDPTQGRVTGLTPFSYAAGAMMAVQDEHVSTNILLGHYGVEVALLTEAAERGNSLVIGGTDQVQAQALLFAAAQEPLIGEEVYAGGAYLGAAPAHIASLQVQDIFRWVLIVAMVLGAVARLLRLF